MDWNPLHAVALPFAHQRLIKMIRKEHKYVAVTQKAISASVREIDYKTTVQLIKLITPLPGEGFGSPRHIRCAVLVNISFDNVPSLERYRSIAENTAYVRSLGIEDTSIAMALAGNAFRSGEYTLEQEKALLQVAVSCHNRSNEQSGTLRAFTYSEAAKGLILQRPEDVQKIMEAARKHPEINSELELAAVMDGITIAPLAGGAL